jgi:hypothetical protein
MAEMRLMEDGFFRRVGSDSTHSGGVRYFDIGTPRGGDAQERRNRQADAAERRIVRPKAKAISRPSRVKAALGRASQVALEGTGAVLSSASSGARNLATRTGSFVRDTVAALEPRIARNVARAKAAASNPINRAHVAAPFASMVMY